MLYVELDAPQKGAWKELYTFFLQNGKSLSLTGRHKVPTITKDGKVFEKRADALITGEMVACMDETGSVSCSPVTEITRQSVESGVGNFAVRGNPIANGVVASVRNDGDVPDWVWNAG